METKICTKCKVEQDIENFYIRRTRNNQRKTICRDCELKSKLKPIPVVEDLDGEIWKDIQYYEGIYVISNYGRVKRIMHRKNPTNTLMNNINNPSGYPYIYLTKNGKGKHRALHILVALHFIPNLDNKPEVNHKDLNTNNYSIDNLEWCTRKENVEHAWENGACVAKKGEDCYNSKFTEKDILFIRENQGIIPAKKLALDFNVQINCIYKIFKRITWKHI